MPCEPRLTQLPKGSSSIFQMVRGGFGDAFGTLKDIGATKCVKLGRWTEGIFFFRLGSQDHLVSVRPSSNTTDVSLERRTCTSPPPPIRPPNLPTELSAAELFMIAAGADEAQHILQARKEA